MTGRRAHVQAAAALIGLLLAVPVAAPSAQSASDGGLDPALRERRQAEDLVASGLRAKIVLRSIARENERLKREIAAMKARRDGKPLAKDVLSAAAADDQLRKLREDRRKLQAESDRQGGVQTGVKARVERVSMKAMARLSGNVRSPAALKAALGKRVPVGPVHFSCRRYDHALTQLVCRSKDLAKLDQRLESMTQKKERTLNSIEKRKLRRLNEWFLEELKGCVPSMAEMLGNPDQLGEARGCVARRYRARLLAIDPNLKKLEKLKPRVVDRTPAASINLGPKLNKPAFSRTRANFRTRPSLNGKVIRVVNACTPLTIKHQVVGSDWFYVRIKGKDGFMAKSVVSDRKPTSCGQTASLISGRVQSVIDTGTLKINGRNVRLDGISGRKSASLNRDFYSFIRSLGGNVRCTPRSKGRYLCRTVPTSDNKPVDLAHAAIFNGAACPLKGAPQRYREAYKKARANGSRLTCN